MGSAGDRKRWRAARRSTIERLAPEADAVPLADGKATTGWCPVHDKVYDSDDGLCPRCGSQLIDESASPRSGAPSLIHVRSGSEGAPASSRERAGLPSKALIGLAAALALVGAGVVIGRGTRDPAPAARDTGGDVTWSIRPGSVRSSDGISLTLERVSQAGRTVEVVLTPAAAGDRPISGASAKLTTDKSSYEGSFGREIQEQVPLAAVFELNDPSERIRRIEVSAVEAPLRSEEMTVSVASVWPATASDEPRVLRVDRSADLAGRRVRLARVLVWRGRVELIFDLNEAAVGPFVIDIHGAEVTPHSRELGPFPAQDHGLEWDQPELPSVRIPTEHLPTDLAEIGALVYGVRSFPGSWRWEIASAS